MQNQEQTIKNKYPEMTDARKVEILRKLLKKTAEEQKSRLIQPNNEYKRRVKLLAKEFGCEPAELKAIIEPIILEMFYEMIAENKKDEEN